MAKNNLLAIPIFNLNFLPRIISLRDKKMVEPIVSPSIDCECISYHRHYEGSGSSINLVFSLQKNQSEMDRASLIYESG
jgi:hypothetical protein